MKKLVFFFLLWVPFFAQSQYKEWAKKRLDSLCSETYFGRGYLKNGDTKAAQFISQEFSKLGLQSLPSLNGYFQDFAFRVNRFPLDPECIIENTNLQVGFEFVPDPSCPSVQGVFNLLYPDSETFDNPAQFHRFIKKCKFGTFVVLDPVKFSHLEHPERYLEFQSKPGKARGIVYIKNQLIWSVAMGVRAFPVIEILEEKLSSHPSSMELSISSEVVVHNAKNVVGIIKGTSMPDSFFVVSAHYDHLGGMGENLFYPGANDNASGTVLMLSMARYFQQHPPKYSMVFIAFAGEEVGLLGSTWMAANPPVALSKIVFMVNFDLEGTGSKGATVVNATEFPNAFQLLQKINNVENYLPVIYSRGQSMNSDHAPFFQAGVPCFYPYLMGDYSWYHQPQDAPEVLQMEKFDETLKLWTSFLEQYSQNR